MSKCRRCDKEVDKHTTMFGYCKDCQKELAGSEYHEEDKKMHIRGELE